MDRQWCVASLSVSVMIVSWRLSPVAAQAKPGDHWRRPSLNRSRPSLSEQVCTTLTKGRPTPSETTPTLPPPRSPSSVYHTSYDASHTETVMHHCKDPTWVICVCFYSMDKQTHTHQRVCVCVSQQQDMCVRVLVETNHLFGWMWVSLSRPLSCCSCPTDVLLVFSAVLFLVSSVCLEPRGLITVHDGTFEKVLVKSP